MTSDILLATLNARYTHCAFGLRYLFANLGDELQSRARIEEYVISDSPKDVAERILASDPRILGLGVYIWNTEQTLQLISILKRVRPEVSHEADDQPICRIADYVIQGEADLLFADFCRQALAGALPASKWIRGELPGLSKLALPYSLYSDDDVRNRILYVEASRGCPYKCEYCLSSLDKSVRNFDLDSFLAEMERLIARGARQFKFVDRTFNLSIPTSARILQFFLDRMHLGLFAHFELVPDRLPAELRELVARFPAGSLQLEIGIQTWNADVSKLISRRQDLARIRDNFAFLREKTGVHTHADLIVGLPSETLESFARGFDALGELGPSEIQVGILKRLKGTPIMRHDQEWAMVYQEHPPFQVLSTRTMGFAAIQAMTRFSKFWDLVANSGNFNATMRLLREQARARDDGSLFWLFHELSEFLRARHPHAHGIALLKLVESMWGYLTGALQLDPQVARVALVQDYAGTVSRDIPRFLREEASSPAPPRARRPLGSMLPERQQRHLAGDVTPRVAR